MRLIQPSCGCSTLGRYKQFNSLQWYGIGAEICDDNYKTDSIQRGVLIFPALLLSLRIFVCCCARRTTNTSTQLPFRGIHVTGLSWPHVNAILFFRQLSMPILRNASHIQMMALIHAKHSSSAMPLHGSRLVTRESLHTAHT